MIDIPYILVGRPINVPDKIGTSYVLVGRNLFRHRRDESRPRRFCRLTACLLMVLRAQLMHGRNHRARVLRRDGGMNTVA